jgi:AraC-like DNA-binding protein
VRPRKVNTLELIRRAKDYLAQYLLQSPQQRAGLSQTARALGASSSSLALAFRTIEKISFYRYALNLRLARAAQLLPTCDDLASLAADLGFASHSHFSTAFNRWAGRTPSDFRTEARREFRPEHAGDAKNPGVALLSPWAARAAANTKGQHRVQKHQAPVQFPAPGDGRRDPGGGPAVCAQGEWLQ